MMDPCDMHTRCVYKGTLRHDRARALSGQCSRLSKHHLDFSMCTQLPSRPSTTQTLGSTAAAVLPRWRCINQQGAELLWLQGRLLSARKVKFMTRQRQ
jgi:hypothetical protein